MKKIVILTLLLSAVLIASCDHADLSSPVALFSAQTTPRYMFMVNLDASGSFSTEESDRLEYRWDLNGDHLEWETDWTSNPVVTVQFPYEHNGYIGLQVRGSSGTITELYQGFYTWEDYRIQNAWSDLEIDFRRIDYDFSYPDHHRTWVWAYDNIQLQDSQQWYNFQSSEERAKYGTLMPWSVADTLDKDYRLPSRAEWQQMTDYCGGAGLAGFNLQVKAEHGLQLTCPGKITDGQLLEHRETGYYWTGDEVDEDSAWALKITAEGDEAEFVILDKSTMASVRLTIEFLYF